MAITLSTVKISSGNNIFIMLFMIFLLGLGYYCSMINLLNKEWLSRSGSLVVVLGIISGFSGIIQEKILLSQLEIRKRVLILQKRRKLRLLNTSKAHIDKELEAIELTFTEQASEMLKVIKFNVGLIEGVLLIVGTIVWAFGDIFMLYLK